MLRSLTNLHNFPSPPGGLGNWWHACKHEVEPSNTHASGGHGQSWGTWQACSSLVTELTTPSFSPRHAHCEGGCPEGAPGPQPIIGTQTCPPWGLTTAGLLMAINTRWGVHAPAQGSFCWASKMLRLCHHAHTAGQRQLTRSEDFWSLPGC